MGQCTVRFKQTAEIRTNNIGRRLANQARHRNITARTFSQSVHNQKIFDGAVVHYKCSRTHRLASAFYELFTLNNRPSSAGISSIK